MACYCQTPLTRCCSEISVCQSRSSAMIVKQTGASSRPVASYPTHRCCGWLWCSRPSTLLVHYIQCKSPPPPSRPSLSQITTQQQQGHWVICERRVPCPCPEQRSGEINHWVPAAATTGPARSRVSASHAWAPTCRDFVVDFVSPGGRVSAGGGCIGLRHPLPVLHRRRTLLDHVTSLQVLRPTSIGKTCRPIMQALCRGGEAAGCCGPITPALWPANRQQ